MSAMIQCRACGSKTTAGRARCQWCNMLLDGRRSNRSAAPNRPPTMRVGPKPKGFEQRPSTERWQQLLEEPTVALPVEDPDELEASGPIGEFLDAAEGATVPPEGLPESQDGEVAGGLEGRSGAPPEVRDQDPTKTPLPSDTPPAGVRRPRPAPPPRPAANGRPTAVHRHEPMLPADRDPVRRRRSSGRRRSRALSAEGRSESTQQGRPPTPRRPDQPTPERIYLVSPMLGDPWPVVRDAPTTIGRGAESTILFPVTAVSRTHAVILFDGRQFRVRDLHSTNGTYVNGRRVVESVLNHEDVLAVGPFEIEIRFAADEAERERMDTRLLRRETRVIVNADL